MVKGSHRNPFRTLPPEEMREYFSVDYPTVTEIKSRYGDSFLDLNQESRLSREDVAHAISEVADRKAALYIPEDFPAWEEATFSKDYHGRKAVIALDTPYKFKKFGREININTTRLGVNAAREFGKRTT
jgi:hypothetical protein